MRAGLDDVALLHDHDLVGVADGGETVGDDEAGPVLHQLDHGVLDLLLRAGVHTGGGLVQNQDLRIAEEGPPDGQKLPLPLREIRARGGQHRIITVRQRSDHLVAVGTLGSLDHFLVGDAAVGVFEIVAHGVGEQNAVLQNDACRVAQHIAGDVPDIHPVDRDGTAVQLIKAYQQIDDGGFAGTGRADQRYFFTRLDLEVEVVYHPFAGDIAEIHMLELDDALVNGQYAVAALILALSVKDGEDALRAGDGGLNLTVELSKLVDGAAELLGVDDKGRDHTHRDHPPEGKPRAEGRDDHEGEVVDHVHQRPHGVADHIGNDAGFGQRIAGLSKVADGRILEIIGRDGLCGADLLLHNAVELAQQHLPLEVIAPHEHGHHTRHEDRQQHRHAGQQRQRDAVAEHHDHRADEHQHAGEQGRQRGTDDVGDIFGVVGHAAHEVAVRVIVQIGDGKRDDLAEKLCTQPINDPLTEACGQKALQERGNAVENIHAEHHAENRRDGLKVPCHKIIDGAAQQARCDDAGRDAEHDAECEVDDIIQLRPEVRQQTAKRLPPVFGLFRGGTKAGAAPPKALLCCSGLDTAAHAVASSRSWES